MTCDVQDSPWNKLTLPTSSKLPVPIGAQPRVGFALSGSPQLANRIATAKIDNERGSELIYFSSTNFSPFQVTLCKIFFVFALRTRTVRPCCGKSNRKS